MTGLNDPVALLLITIPAVFYQHEAANSYLLKYDGAEASLMLSAEFEFIKCIVILCNQTFDLPCHTDI
jgi:hypothetical protein